MSVLKLSNMIIGRVGGMVRETGQVGQLVNVVKQLTDVVGDRWRAWISTFQMLFENLAHT